MQADAAQRKEQVTGLQPRALSETRRVEGHDLEPDPRLLRVRPQVRPPRRLDRVPLRRIGAGRGLRPPISRD